MRLNRKLSPLCNLKRWHVPPPSLLHCPYMSTVVDAGAPAAESDLRALGQAFVMILVSEVGDKTFLIAAILAMRHDRLVVFAGAFGSLVVMSILSAAVGHLLPTLIPKQWTQFAAAVLFLVFGSKMLMEAREMASGSDKIQEEMKEVEEELEEADAKIPMEAMEAGVVKAKPRSRSRPSSPTATSSILPVRSFIEGTRNCANFFLGPVFVQAFVLTFLGEWGDRSQIATIALAAAHNVYVVSVGTIAGHSICTAVAVLGGRWLSTKISVRHVTFGGSILFLLFAIIYFYEAWTYEAEVNPAVAFLIPPA